MTYRKWKVRKYGAWVVFDPRGEIAHVRRDWANALAVATQRADEAAWAEQMGILR